MPTSKIQFINELSQNTIKEITNTPEKWISFLNTASNNYKYSFNEQILIYAQKPDATACADIDTWNTKLKRWVNKGAKGIALVTIVNGRTALRHVFDVADTNSKFGRKFELWGVKEEYNENIIETLENSFGELNDKEDLAHAIISASYNLVDDNAQDYLAELMLIKENSFLEELDELNTELNFRNLLSNSVSYMIMKRCGINPMEIFEIDDFRNITNFNTNQVISRLGIATSDIAETGLREIYSTIREIQISEKNTIRTFEKNDNVVYDNINNKNNERGNENGFNLQTSRRLSSTRVGSATEQGDATRQIFENETELSERTQERAIHRTNDDLQNGGTFGRDRGESENSNRTDSEQISRTEQSGRAIETNQPNGMGMLDEQFQESSRGDNNAGTNIQLSFLSELEQINRVNELAEVENTPAFSFAQDNQNPKSLEERLLEFETEYDIFDTSDPNDEYGEIPRTLEMVRNDLENKKSIKEYIDYYESILVAEDEPESELSQKLGVFIDEMNNMLIEKSNLIQGSVVYLEDDQNQYIVNNIDKENNIAQLLDYDLYMNKHIVVIIEMPYTRFKDLYLIQEQNFTDSQFSIVPSVNERVIQIPPTEEREPLTNYILKNEINATEKINYHINNNQLGEGTPREKYRRNVEAIRILKKCENENRLATKKEQEILANYIGWGGLSDCFDKSKDTWHNEYVELKGLLDDEEYKNARASTTSSFYTPPIVIRAIYKTLQNMGIQNASILEPSCGVGNFFGMLPEELGNSKLYGVELDSISGRIAKQLYQKANIHINGYEKEYIPDNNFDVAVGNVPFDNVREDYNGNSFLTHDLFFAKTIDKVRAGGVIAFITSKGTLDKQNPSFRKYIAQRADLIGAIRLPNNTFSKNAGTFVTSDIIFLQKRENMTEIMPDWVYLNKNEDNIVMNKYFIDHPEMILGKMEMKPIQYGRLNSTCTAFKNENLEDLLNKAITNINAEIQEYSVENDLESDDKSIPATPDVKNYSYAVKDGKLYYRENNQMILQELPITTENRIKGMIALREQIRQVIDYQMEGYSDEDIQLSQAKLNEVYDKFTKEYGLINTRANSRAFADDNSYYLLCSLEKLDGDGNFIGKADIFTKRTIKANVEIEKVDTANEALIISIQEKAKVDLEYMQKLCGLDKEVMLKNLEGEIFNVPEYGNSETWVTADEYLSGNVREKIKIAKEFAKQDSRFQINVDKLKEVIPKDLSASEIGIKLGATWIPPETVAEFIYELLGTPFYCQRKMKIRFSEITSEWYIENKNWDSGNVKAYSTYGTKRINAYKIIEQTLNLKDVKVFDTYTDADGKKQTVLNKKETAIAQSKQDIIKQAFLDWVWKEPERREKLTRIYNDKFNSIRPREYDGSHINFVGMNPEIKLRKHQLNAIAHVLYGRNTLLAHEVGAGKTFEMVASAMESKRLGLATKSLFAVPNHIVEQFASEFLQLYPSANILVTTKKDFELKNRKKFCSRIATGEYDAVIIGHSQFEKIPISDERQKQYLEAQIDDIIRAIEDIKRDNGEKFTIKQLEQSKRQLQVKLDKLNSRDKKDDVITFEELGVDKLFVDEAHSYKNLFLYTKMQNVGGIAQTEAQKSSDMFLKCRYLDEITGGRGTVFATGTPVSNSMAELYTMQRYLQYEDLRKHDLQHFDNWASTFGETVTAIELKPEGTGYKAKTRFSKFHNLPELMSLFKEIADIQTADTLNLPTPKCKKINVAVKPSQIQKDMVASLGDRAEKIRNKEVDASVDNMLKITNEGRKLALDQRLINPLLEDFENSKINACVDNIYKIWKDGKQDKLTQLVFCDLSTPKDNNGFEKEEFTDVYNDVKKKLIARGVPKEEVAYIHEADTEAKKKELFAKVRSGDVRVLIGSTQKMGAGTNVQEKLIALHHLDCPWRPADLTQREGRIIRQGNQNKKVYTYTYVTEGTFDAYLYQLVEKKQEFISQIMTSKTPVRTMEDIDEKALSYGEIKALATGNPKILEKTNLDAEVSKLNLLKQSFMNEKYMLQDKISKYFPKQIAECEEQIGLMEEDMIKLHEYTKPNKDGFSPMKINGITYTEKAVAGAKILECCKELKSMECKEIGEYRGFKMSLIFDYLNKVFSMKLQNKMTYTIDLGIDSFGNITRINNCLENIEKEIPNERERLDYIKLQLKNSKVEVEKEFPQEQELKEKQQKLIQLNKELKIDDIEKEMFANEKEDDEISKDKGSKQDRGR